MSTPVMEMFSLAGRTAVITGGTRGIGAEMAIALAEAGSDIILVQVRIARGYNHNPSLLLPLLLES